MGLLLKKENFPFIFIPITLSIVGLIFIYSTGQLENGGNTNFYIRQLFWVLAGLALAGLIVAIDYYYMVEMSTIYYIVGCLFLVLTLFFGREIKGARSWFGYGGLGIQVSEIMKIAYILFYAKFLKDRNNLENVYIFFIKAGLILFIPLALILRQPDLGTSLVFLNIFVVMTLMGSKDIRLIIDIVAIAVTTSLLTLAYAYYRYYYISLGRESINIWEFFLSPNNFLMISFICLTYTVFAFLFSLFKPIEIINRFLRPSYLIGFPFLVSALVAKILKPYQWSRLLIFINPEFDRLGTGYNVLQAQIAIGAGGWFGQGLFRGTQNLRRFLPEKHTDFIFAIIAEETGFIGSFLVLLLYMIYIGLIIKTIFSAKDSEGCFVASGILAMFICHIVINIGMNLGIAPVTGLPLPMISYGGSSYLSFIVASAILLSIYNRRFVH
ncbi:MAG: rod shape-determining protein RodA [Brevinema sp.]